MERETCSEIIEKTLIDVQMYRKNLQLYGEFCQAEISLILAQREVTIL